VFVNLCELLKSVFLVLREIVFVSLGKYKEGLVPEGWEFSVIIRKVHEVFIYCINHLFEAHEINRRRRRKKKEKKRKEKKK
jgi:hypothetical protein